MKSLLSTMAAQAVRTGATFAGVLVEMRAPPSLSSSMAALSSPLPPPGDAHQGRHILGPRAAAGSMQQLLAPCWLACFRAFAVLSHKSSS